MKLAWDNKADAATVTAGSEIATLPGTNVQKPHLSRKWHTAAGVKSSNLVFDMLSSVACSMLAVLGANLTPAATHRLRGSDTDAAALANAWVDTGVVAAGVKTGYGAIYKAVQLAYLSSPGSNGNYASTPDSAAISIVADIDLRVKVAANDYTPAADNAPLSKWDATGNQRSYFLNITAAGLLQLNWSNDGIASIVKGSTVAIGATDARAIWLRATLDVDNGAAGNDVRFYTSDDYDPLTNTGTWNQLGATVTTAGVTSIFDSNAVLLVSGLNGGTANPFAGKVFYAEVRNGINGAIAASFDPRRATNGAASFVSLQGETWTINTSGAPAAALVVDSSHTARYWRLDLTDNTVPDNLQVGRVFLGPSWTHAKSLLYGWGLTPVDPSPIAKSRGGQSYPDALPKFRIGEFSLDYLTEAEIYDNLFAMARANGVVKDVLAIPFETGAYTSEQAIWGLVQPYEPVVHRLSQTFRQKFRIEERL